MRNSALTMALVAAWAGLALWGGCRAGRHAQKPGQAPPVSEAQPPRMDVPPPTPAESVPSPPSEADSRETTEPPAEEFTYYCPDHPDQRSEVPAKCPICDKPMAADTQEAVEYYCPVHPEVVSDSPGVCEKQGCDGLPLKARLKKERPARGTGIPARRAAP